MTETKIDKRKESLLALKNANKHLTEILSALDRNNEIMGEVSDALNRAAGKVGDVYVEVFSEGKWGQRPLKTVLQEYANKLNSARS